ncbi:unnamed protein product [Penicillium camemberti]|uniref:Str. FM013 n=1 Tax=Penicillium camemberti (strain FM 013) TaxID=1429867 RepID=A0A0G4PTX7_PENC3|nr:unnamed protein product [Penicillium camemberti]
MKVDEKHSHNGSVLHLLKHLRKVYPHATTGFEYSAWRTEASSQFKSKAGSGDLIVISGTPRVGQGRPLPLGSITRVSNEDVIHPPMDCIYVSSASKKK